MRRRQFLTTGASLATGAWLSTLTGSSRKARAAGAPSLSDWEAVRRQFALDRRVRHFAGMLFASHPKPVREAIDTYRRALDRNPVEAIHQHQGEREQAARVAAADYMHTNAEALALTDSTTMGLGLVYNGLQLQPGDEILTTEHDHYATQQSLTHRAQRTGALVRRIRLYETLAAVSEDALVERVVQNLSARTRVLAVTWVHSSTGLKLPIARLGQAVATHNRDRAQHERVLLCVDGVHGFGVDDINIKDFQCDFFVAGCHKWLFGPRGTGIVWGSPQGWSRVQPFIPSFEPSVFGAWLAGQPIDNTTAPAAYLATPGGFHTFEHRWALDAAFLFHQQLGKRRVQARIAGLNTQLKEGLAKMPHVTLVTPRAEQLSAGIVCFQVQGTKPQEVVARLAEQGIVGSVTPYAVAYARLSPGLLNSPDDVDAALAALRGLS